MSAGKQKKKSTRRTHPNHTRGTQQLIHQLVINAPYTEYEASNGYVSSRLTNKNSNKGVVDESEIYDRH